MHQLLQSEEVETSVLPLKDRRRLEDCRRLFNDATPTLFHLLFFFEDDLLRGTRSRPESAYLHRESEPYLIRLCKFGVVIEHPTAGFALTDDGKQFMLRVRYEKMRETSGTFAFGSFSQSSELAESLSNVPKRRRRKPITD